MARGSPLWTEAEHQKEEGRGAGPQALSPQGLISCQCLPGAELPRGQWAGAQKRPQGQLPWEYGSGQRLDLGWGRAGAENNQHKAG